MRGLTLDFQRQRNSAWLGIAFLMAGVLAAAAAGNEYWRIGDESTGLQARIRERGAVQRKDAPTANDGRKDLADVTYARQVVLQLGTPWIRLFTSLEEADAPTVALLSIESDAEKRRVKISAEAKNLGAMLDYVAALERRETLVEVFLQSHHVQQQDPQRPVRFVVSASWSGRQ